MKNNNITNGYYDSENISKFTEGEKRLWNRMFECREKIECILRSKPMLMGKGYSKNALAVPLAAYILYEISSYNNPFMSYDDAIETIDDVLLKEQAKECSISDFWNELLELLKEYDRNIFALVAKLKDLYNPMKTPECVNSLAYELLNICENDKVADFCCGTGSFSQMVRDENPTVSITGYDIDDASIAMAKIMQLCEDENMQFINEDIFNLVMKSTCKCQFTKIFANYPFGMRIKELILGREYLEELTKRIPSISKATSSDWLYNMLIIDMLSEKGKAVSIMTNGSTWNMIDAPIRKYFIEKGLIECVIELPTKLYPNTGVATSMIVFSHNNKGVRIIDASKLYVSGRRVNEISDENIDLILSLLDRDTDNSIFIDTENLRDNEYVLNINRYQGVSDDIEDGVAFDSVIKRITRGAQLNANQLDLIASAEPTNMQYLMLSNIQNGLIDKDLPYITEIDKKNEKYCLTNHCLILSKNGYPYKVAVAEINQDIKVLANGNLYIIELDEEKVNPYYLAAFFASDRGIAALKSITVGATIPNIGVEQLKNLVIPVPELEKQNQIAEKYQALKDEIVLLQLKLEKTKNRIAHILEEGGEN